MENGKISKTFLFGQVPTQKEVDKQQITKPHYMYMTTNKKNDSINFFFFNAMNCQFRINLLWLWLPESLFLN